MKPLIEELHNLADVSAILGTLSTTVSLLIWGPRPFIILIILTALWLWIILHLAAYLAKRAHETNTFLWERKLHGPTQSDADDEIIGGQGDPRSLP